ncbi:LytR/AlgR family response regulator transcription factor [Pedobacter zeae]|uniref:DNA-binding LytR/AlgR family response regulator n=1 Tax=Pedobacter zeae TaxID=1737356 RepID=A0A7W6K9L1_9SPHI|nr:LytTR family DNA-binding domain-containing protein [Pedobacter zeae]MBB4106756.1 DNA-binding LytR/AlgR family response regulator [Pedobacter zeae]GGH03552.1 DNA-binding response regulator [Pedobacter zeae]
MYTCIIIDDEPHALEGLKSYIEKVPELVLVKEFTSSIDALRNIPKMEPIDLVFLDIDMPDVSGLELAKLLKKHIRKLIFTTAHSKYGYEAFEIKASDYLLKPYSLSKFLSAVQDLFPSVDFKEYRTENQHIEENFFFVKSKSHNLKLVKIRFEDIILVESKLNYVDIFTTDKCVTTYMSLTEISKRLSPERGFLKFQRSFIINKTHIDSVDGNEVLMDNGKKITVGHYYRKEFNDFLSKNIFRPNRKN